MKILIEESVLRQALDALEKVAELTGARWALENNYAGHLEAIASMQSHLDAAEKVEPVCKWPKGRCGIDELLHDGHPAPAVPEVPAGWQLVPRSATIEMIDAGDFREAGNGSELVAAIYASMLSAAPTPPTPQPNTDELLKHHKISSELVDSEPRRVLPIIPAEESDEEFVRQVEATQCMDDSELREAARAVVKLWKQSPALVMDDDIDRLDKAL